MAQILCTVTKNPLFSLAKLRPIRSYALFGRKKEDSYLLMRARPNDYEETIDLMWKAYFPEEPLVSCVGLGNKRNPLFDEEARRALCEGASVVARCKYNGMVVGACINESAAPFDPDVRDHIACCVSCVQIRQLFHFYAFLQRAPNIWEKYGAQKVMELCHLFVKPSERGKGLAKRLLIASVDNALDCGYDVIRVDATNHYTAKICKDLNFRLIYEIPYCTYMGQDNKPIFNPPEPHRSVKVYVFESTMTLNRQKKKKKK